MNRNHKLPWRTEVVGRNSYVLLSADDLVIAQRMRKKDAEYIAYRVNSYPQLAANNRAMAKSLENAEITIAKLRAYIRDNEVNVLRGIKLGVYHEAI